MDLFRIFAPFVRLTAVAALALAATSCAIYPDTPVWKTKMAKGKHIKNLSERSLLRKARQDTVDHGLSEAREELLVNLRNLDAKNGLLETRLSMATANPGMVFEDAIRTMPKSERSKVGFLMVPGTSSGSGFDVATLVSCGGGPPGVAPDCDKPKPVIGATSAASCTADL